MDCSCVTAPIISLSAASKGVTEPFLIGSDIVEIMEKEIGMRSGSQTWAASAAMILSHGVAFCSVVLQAVNHSEGLGVAQPAHSDAVGPSSSCIVSAAVNLITKWI